MQVDTLMFDYGANIYYDDDFRRVLEDHLMLLRTNANTIVINVEAIKAYQYEFDLYGLLAYHNIPPYLHWLVMRINKFVTTTDATRDIEFLLVPDQTTVDQIRQSHQTTRRIT